jgi:hypothetical protein
MAHCSAPTSRGALYHHFVSQGPVLHAHGQRLIMAVARVSAN